MPYFRYKFHCRISEINTATIATYKNADIYSNYVLTYQFSLCHQLCGPVALF